MFRGHIVNVIVLWLLSTLRGPLYHIHGISFLVDSYHDDDNYCGSVSAVALVCPWVLILSCKIEAAWSVLYTACTVVISNYSYVHACTATNMHGSAQLVPVLCTALSTFGNPWKCSRCISIKPKMLWKEMTWTGREHKLGHPCALKVLLMIYYITAKRLFWLHYLITLCSDVCMTTYRSPVAFPSYIATIN